jgi:hypothetical protein
VALLGIRRRARDQPPNAEPSKRNPTAEKEIITALLKE